MKLHEVSFRRELQKAVVFHTKLPFPTTVEALREVFDIIDTDKSGLISIDEIRAMLLKLNRLVSEEEIQGVMKSLDIDASSAVDFEEFKHIFELSDSTRRKKAKY